MQLFKDFEILINVFNHSFIHLLVIRFYSLIQSLVG